MRRSGRLSSSGTTKSRYFEDDVVEIVASETVPPKKVAKRKPSSSSKRRGSSSGELQLDHNDMSALSSENDLDKDETPPRKRGRPPKSNSKKRRVDENPIAGPSRNKGVARPAEPTVENAGKLSIDQGAEGDENNDDSDGGHPHVEFIPLPKLRDTGDVNYEPETIHPNTLEFLKDLKANNKRSWLKLRDPEFRRSLKDWDSFVETLTVKITEADETIPELPLKDVIFRIYRDIRFSKDPTPYKPHYSAAWSRTGRKGPYACYYVHCEPGSCFVGGGLWHPDKDALAKLRANIDERPHRLRRVLMNPDFRKAFLPKSNSDEASVLASFCDSNKNNALKIRPQGFHPDHRDIALLKLRNYTVGRKIKDSDLTDQDAQEKIMSIVNPMVEYVTFLNSVVMPDPNLDSDSESDNQDTEVHS